MERPVRTKFNTQIYEEACEWFIECRSGDLDARARTELDRWLRKSPEHQSAYLEIAAIWNEGPTLDPGNQWDLDTLIAEAAEESSNVVPLERTPRPLIAQQPGANNIGATSPERPSRKPFTEDAIASASDAASGPRTQAPGSTAGRRRLVALAASILLTTAAGVVYLLAPRGIYTTALGEQRSLALDDGSTVQLNALSKIRIRYSRYQRTVELIEGQALFHVAKDVNRPFIVQSGPTRVRAVGTQFDVHRRTSDTTVTVVEGRVAVLPATASREASAPVTIPEGDGSILLGAGEQVTVTPQATHRIPHPNLAGATAWTQRQLVFDSASLADVADEFNRYNQRKLVIDPSALDNQHVNGVFSSTDPASLIRFLHDRSGLRVTETSTEIRVEKNH